MNVTVDVVGGERHDVDAEPNATYADLVRAVDLNVNEVSVLVDGSPVPEDQPIDADRVEVLRLIQGG